MKPNEIGHFPYQKPRHQFDDGGYHKEIISHDENGNLKLNENGNLIWLPTWISLGEVETFVIPPEGFKKDNCVYDLQSSSDSCYYAADVTILHPGNEIGVNYIYLIGNGWADFGFPFYDETFDPKKPYETGKGCYAYIRRKARERFLKHCDKGTMDFENVTTGNIRDDFVLPNS